MVNFSFELIHKCIISTIQQFGALEGITLYKRHRKSYHDLPSEKASKSWGEIFSTIHKKENLGPISLLAKDDPFLETDPSSFTNNEMHDIIEYRRNLPLNPSLADFMMDVYKFRLEPRDKKDWIPIYHFKSKSEALVRNLLKGQKDSIILN